MILFHKTVEAKFTLTYKSYFKFEDKMTVEL